jgi:tetratricopeptide (TPR) repeat protein
MNRSLFLFILLLIVFRTAWSQDKPRKPFQLFETAEQEFSSGNYEATLSLLDECLKLNPGYMEAYPLRGGAKEQLNDLPGALTDYSIYLEKFPFHPDVLMSRAVARYKLGFYDQAKEDFRNLLKLQSNETTAIFYKQNMSVDDKNPMMTTSQEGHNAFVYNYLGLIEYKMKNPRLAIAYYDTAIRMESKEPDFYVNRGLAKETLNDSTAIVEFEIALRLNPNHTLAKHNLEAHQAKKIQVMSVEDRLTRTIEADSTMLYPYIERAQQRFESGYFEGALDDYNQAAELAPNNFEILFARGLTKEKLKNYDGAFSDYTKAIEIKENYPKAWLSRGNVLLKLERYDDAIEDYNVALVYQSDYSLAYHNRGMAKVKLKKNAEACADFKRAEELGMKVDGKIKAKVCE